MLANAQQHQNIPASLQVCFGGFSSAGVKDENQDAFAALTPSANELKAKGAVAVLADGVSSANKAAEAAQLAVTQFTQEYYATSDTWSTQKSASKVLTSLNQWLYSQDSQLNSTSTLFSQQWLTTFSALILKSNTGYLFHVGDSRISQFRKNTLEQITRDHNQKRGTSHAVLTRALGADTRLKVDVHQIELQAGDIYILTCDGVHDFISQAELKKCLNQPAKTIDANWLEQTSKQIVQIALENGSDDNVSCLLVYVNNVPNKDTSEIERNLLYRTIPPALTPGMKLDGYKVIKPIHASIRSHLYLVKHENEDKPQVLKTPSTNFSDDPIYLQGFIREAWVGERLTQSNVMKVKSSASNSQFLYHICEYVEGQTLTEWMQENPTPSVSQVRDIIKQIIAALRAFQRLDLVHRDLKPDNVMINQYGQVKLIDYGTVWVASLDENSETLSESVPQGSLDFIAPETLLTLHADQQSDLFSLGVICFQMLTGELPYKPMKRAEVSFSRYDQWHYRSAKQFRPDLPIWLDLCLQRATAADPSARYLAYSEFDTDLNKPNVNAIQVYESQPLLQRNPIKFWQGVSLFFFITTLFGIFY